MSTVISLDLDERAASKALEIAQSEHRSLASVALEAVETFVRLPKEVRERLANAVDEEAALCAALKELSARETLLARANFELATLLLAADGPHEPLPGDVTDLELGELATSLTKSVLRERKVAR
ncbi:MAG: hypothetical protein ACLPN5_00990 [Roseiarcus sp.]